MKHSWTAVSLCVLMAMFLTMVGAADEICQYRLTENSYDCRTEMDIVVQKEFGPGAEVADWFVLKAEFAGQIAAVCNAVGLAGDQSQAWVYRKGEAYHSTGGHFLIERNNGELPGGWLVHDQIDDYTISLGSGGIEKKILVRVPIAPPPTDNTIGGNIICQPPSGVLPYDCLFTVNLANYYQSQSRRVQYQVDVALAGGPHFTNWRRGWQNIRPNEVYSRNWMQRIPALGDLIGQNSFMLHALDVTPPPYNWPPYPPSGDTAMGNCTVTGIDGNFTM